MEAGVSPAAPRPAAVPVLDPQNVLWYFGALAGTLACLAILSQVHESARGAWILVVSLVFIAAYAAAVAALLRAGWLVPAGVLAATAVTFVPVAGAAFERLVGVGGGHPVPDATAVIGEATAAPPIPADSFHGSAFALALLTVAAGIGVFLVVRYAYVFAWVAVAALVTTQILVPVFDAHPGAEGRFDAALAAGILFAGLGLYLDRAGRRREAFWWHLVGLSAITAALAYHTAAHTSPGWIFALLAGALALALAVLFGRPTYAFFGLLGLYAPFVHYSSDWFGNLGTAFALAVTGFSILGAGIAVHGSRGGAGLRPA